MAEYTIFQDSFLGIGLLLIVGITLVLFLVSHEPMGQRALAVARGVFGNGPIGLMHLALGKHLVQTTQCLRGACKHHES